MTDEELINLSLENDYDAFNCLIERYKGLATHLAFSICKERSDDAVSLAIENAFFKLSSIKNKNKFNKWFAQIVRREAIHIYNNNHEDKYVPYDEQESFIDHLISKEKILPVITENESKDILLTALSHIEFDCRQLLFMKFYDEMTLGEIGEIWGMSTSNVEYHIKKRCLPRLKLLIADNFVEEDLL